MPKNATKQSVPGENQPKSSFPTDFLAKIQKTLETEKMTLEKEFSNTATKNPHTVQEDYDSKFPNYGDKEDENAAEVAEYAANVSIEQDLEKTLRDVKGALDRIKKGSYGTCKYCKKLIDQKRLLARPTSSACVECKKTITQEA